MHENWVPLQSVLQEPKFRNLTDQSVWTEPIRAFGLGCRITKPLRAAFELYPQEDGLLVRGELTGAVALPCTRCTEEAEITLQLRFDSFEPYPAPAAPHPGRSVEEEALLEPDLEVDENFIRLSPQGGLEVNLGALAWEEFSLSLPARPLCKEDCAGLCPVCGQNFNQGACSCPREEGDARLAPLRALKIKKNK